MQYAKEEIYPTLVPELKLVLLCSKLKIHEKEQETIHELITGCLDWNLFLHLTLHHRLYPLVYRYLCKLNHPKIPEIVMASLRQNRNKNISGTLGMIAELVRVMREMLQNGIHAVVLKGFPLAHQLYGDMTLRTSHDLDILVWPKDIDEARVLIEKDGYCLSQPIAKLTSEQLKKWMETNQHLHYWHPEKETCLELHWRLDCHGMDIPLSQAKSSLTKIQIAGQSMSVLGKEELLLYLILHGAVHAWFRLKWLCDIDIMIGQGNFSWGKLYQLADALGVKSVLNQSIILSQELLGTTIPANVAEIIKNDMQARKMAVMALRFIMDNEYKPKKPVKIAFLLFQWHRYQFCLQSKWKKKLLLICRCFLPSEDDLKIISLSEKLYFMYYMISPFTWLGRRVWNMARRYNLS